MNLRIATFVLCLAFCINGMAGAGDWRPASSPLETPWTHRVDPKNPLPEHPRPGFQRTTWLSLNGLWDYLVEPVDFKPMQGFIDRESMTTGALPEKYQGKILVPFAIDAPLSGIMHVLRPQERLWYRREFEIPRDWKGQRVLLHVEASDWETGVFVNGRRIGQHRGGYDPFQFDITDALRAGPNTLHLSVWDGTEQHCQPLGKQIMPENRKGFRYQPTGGIWQTVWLEGVPKTYVKSWQGHPAHEWLRLYRAIERTGPGSESEHQSRRAKTGNSHLRRLRDGQWLGQYFQTPALVARLALSLRPEARAERQRRKGPRFGEQLRWAADLCP